ncbi:hypothetical protein [Methanococcoides sp. AM1]|uniref:hypothetical protein n=1 Tax=Methanococcoides sp. AM1 TaxID=1201011 RepID=UPI0010841E69|nr:hypothetical protein [Methanococcoides sp. AM1]
MDKAVVYGLLILFLGIAIGYSINDMATVEEVPGGIQVPEMSAGGHFADENNTDVPIWSYDITLYNSGNEDVYVNSVEPIFGENFSKNIVTENNTIVVEKIINETSSIGVSGQVKLNTTGLSEFSIIGYNITSTETIYWPMSRNLKRTWKTHALSV